MKYAKTFVLPQVDDPILNRALQGLDDELKKIGRVLNSIDGLYYTETELDAGQLDNRYYTETEINTLLASQNEFKELTDTPAAYTGHSLKNVRVNTGETGLEFIAPGAPEAHASTHEVGGGDLLAFADITGFGTYLDQALLQASHVIHASITVGNEGLHILDTGADHDLIIKPGTDLSVDRILTLTTGDAARTITLSGNPTLADWFDQAVKQASNVQFNNAYLTGKVGVGTVSPQKSLHISHNTPVIRLSDINAGNDQEVTGVIEFYRGNTTNRVGYLAMASWQNNVLALATEYTDGEIRLKTGNAVDRLTIDKGGNVGIGTASPGTNLHVDGDGSNIWAGYSGGGKAAVIGGKKDIIGGASFEYSAYWAYDAYFDDGDDTWKGVRTNLGRKWKTEACYHTGRYTISYSSLGDPITWLDRIIIDMAGQVGIGKVPTAKLDVNGTIKATLFQGALHWDYITNEPSYYPPEYHYHVGKDIISLHLVDLDDVEADDIFDVMNTAAIHGQGNYDWWGTWSTTAAANTSANIVVLAGDDKMLRLTDNNAGDNVTTVLAVDAPHYMVTGVLQFRIREDDWGTVGVALTKGGARNMEFLMIDDGIGARKFWFFNGTAEIDLATAYALNTWYTVRIHYDCVARAAVIFIDNTFVKRTALSAAAICDYVDAIRIETDPLDTGYVVDINNLKVFNLTI